MTDTLQRSAVRLRPILTLIVTGAPQHETSAQTESRRLLEAVLHKALSVA